MDPKGEATIPRNHHLCPKMESGQIAQCPCLSDDLARGRGTVDIVHLCEAANEIIHGILMDKMKDMCDNQSTDFIGPLSGLNVEGSL